MRKIITFISIFIIAFCINAHNTKAIDTPPTVSADGVVLMDKNTGQVLYSKNLDTQYPPASTTKIMTALLTLENCKLDDVVTVGKNAVNVDGSKVYLFEGEKLTVKDLLYALLLQSANDSAVALSEHVAGSTKEFVNLMNKKAKELGCKNTNFVNPHGLYDDKHRTTARDLGLILRELSKHEEFKQIATTSMYYINPTNKETKKRPIWNKDKLIQKNSKCYYEGCEGGKTGYTIQSKHSFVATATRNNKSLIAVLLHDAKHTYWDDVIKLFDYGFNNYTRETLYNKDQTLCNYNVTNDLKIPILASEDFYYLKRKDAKDAPKLKINDESLGSKSFNKGDIILTGNIIYQNQNLGKVSLASGSNYSSNKLPIKSLSKLSDKQIKALMVCIPLFIILIIGIIFSVKRSRNNNINH
ncbi:D-alanyl-D-alanine carboxypeptidase family protein [Clostridium botulinum]|uniref:serine-type D-Ala-D-Ala carboxypeptidase n=2 Tax=Clostridium botulinum TaxID=1491 RepID=A0A9Q1ZCV1_CLOBO|nr:D-alanyl-D-alanine carboxypeptidase family protein [Clostridium botulinum]AEB76521.1 D-alanyl-D-alanine carboxypeptidase [Clostridium botulinum BKT015925]KEH97453.1 D-alanyl-D-alanine carboxypeptidase [Clostridium botulinum D str. 16868]KEI02010.1 D-alanyl-D-alanine carboxypeptidase [Clostridium botulinum C/D str. Sp77]KLU76097.1 D-alanyl-D-alanine carboxypeptidase [Clostridium botulinum V891]KOA74030.1 D-alanyl-D-alanine carboxypeptidase [Clostridium botulinum]